MSVFGLVTFTAPYLPWIILAFSLLFGNPVSMDVIWIFVGHTYYYLECVYPVIAGIQGWRVKRIMELPGFFHWLCGTFDELPVNQTQQQNLHQE